MKVHHKVREMYENHIPNSVCIVHVDFAVMGSGNIFGIYVKK